MTRPWADIAEGSEVVLTTGMQIGPGHGRHRILRIQSGRGTYTAVMGDVVRAEVLGSHSNLAVLLKALDVYLKARQPTGGRYEPNSGFEGWSRRQYDLQHLMQLSAHEVALAENGWRVKPLDIFDFDVIGASMSITLNERYDLRHGRRNDTVSICTTSDLEAILRAVYTIISAPTPSDKINAASCLARTVEAYENGRNMGGAAPA